MESVLVIEVDMQKQGKLSPEGVASAIVADTSKVAQKVGCTVVV